jgi:lipopolysaccharide transport system permease protein
MVKFVRTTNQTIIEPSRGGSLPDFHEVWAYRELIFLMAWRDIKVRYQHTLLGITWVVLQPLLMMVIFTVIFGKLGKLPAGENYPMLALSGYALWQYFSRCVGESVQSFHMHRNLLTKVYFPRVIVPIVTCIPPIVDFAICLVIVLVAVAITRTPVGPQVMLLPIVGIFHIMFTVAVTIWTSSFCTDFKDFRHLMPFLLQFGLFLSPVAYSSMLVPENWRTIYALNPLVGLIDAARWCVGSSPFPGWELGSGLIVTTLTLFFGLRYYHDLDGRLSDRL